MVNNFELKEVIDRTNLAEEITRAPILITGGTGFIGSWIVAVLNKMSDDKIIENPIYVLTSDKAKAQYLFNNLRYKNIEIYTLEELQNLVLNRSVKGFGDVFHCATSTKYSTDDEKNDFNRTVDFTIKILELIKSTGEAPNFINLSSGAVYESPSNYFRFPERNSSLNINSSLTLYGKLKMKMEQLVISADTEGVVIGSNPRLFTFFGYGLPLDSHFAIGNFINDCLNGKNISVNGNPLTTRSYLYPTDLVIWIIRLLVKPTNMPLNFGSDKSMTMKEIANNLSTTFDERKIEFNNPDSPISNYVPCIENTKKYLGVSQLVSFSEGIERWIKWLKN